MTCCIYCLHGLCRNAQSFLQWLHKKWSAALVPRKEHPLWLLSQKKDLLRYFFGEYWHSFLVLSLIWSLTPMGDLNFMLCNAVCILWLATGIIRQWQFSSVQGQARAKGAQMSVSKNCHENYIFLVSNIFPNLRFPDTGWSQKLFYFKLRLTAFVFQLFQIWKSFHPWKRFSTPDSMINSLKWPRKWLWQNFIMKMRFFTFPFKYFWHLEPGSSILKCCLFLQGGQSWGKLLTQTDTRSVRWYTAREFISHNLKNASKC